MLEIEDEDEHARHFWVRDSGSQGLRPMEKYLRSLPEIRRIQAYLIERAGKAGVPVIDNARIESAVNEVLHLVLAEVERAQEQARA
jgi:2-phosphoglycerate kinase